MFILKNYSLSFFCMSCKNCLFSGVYFAVSDETAARLSTTNTKMVQLLKSGGAEERNLESADLTHIICNTVDHSTIQRVLTNAAFCRTVIPKWVFISQSMHYQLPIVGVTLKYSLVEKLSSGSFLLLFWICFLLS